MCCLSYFIIKFKKKFNDWSFPSLGRKWTPRRVERETRQRPNQTRLRWRRLTDRGWSGRQRMETLFPARHFCNLAFPGLKERFFSWDASSQAGKTVLSMVTQGLGHYFSLVRVIPLSLAAALYCYLLAGMWNILLMLKLWNELVKLNLVEITAWLEL